MVYNLDFVANTIRNYYSEVEELITLTEAEFLKSSEQSLEFHRHCPASTQPLQPIPTR